PAAVTMDNDWLLALQLIFAFGDFTQRDQFRAIDPRDFGFEWLAHIDQRELFPRVHLSFQFVHGYPRNACRVSDTTKLIVVDRRENRGVFTANGTPRISAQL